MKKVINKVGKFYTRIIIDNIGIFIFIGLLSVVFNDCGWFPNEDIYAISQLAYLFILPVIISYESGKKIGGQPGGVLAVLALMGMLSTQRMAGIWGAMVMGPLAGYLFKISHEQVKKHTRASLQMLVKNLYVGVLGIVLTVFGFYVMVPLMNMVTTGLMYGVDFLVQHQIVPVLSIFTEPAKVFFLNNVMNYAVFVPLGMNQVQEVGSSILFLVEVNPGPGFGMMAALLYRDRKRANEYMTAMFTQAVGGLHEVYFPFALSNLWLLLPLIFGGMAGTVVFQIFGAGMEGVVSPGSIITILLMAGKGRGMYVAAGMAVSALISFAGSLAVLKIQERCKMSKHEMAETGRNRKEDSLVFPEHVRQIGVVCDGGVGSSAMGASLLRRKLMQVKEGEIRVEAYAVDLVPENIDLIVCQKEFYQLVSEQLQGRAVYTVDSLLKMAEYEELVNRIQKRNGRE